MVHTLLSAGKVLACYDAVERDQKFNCKILTIEGDTISAGPEQEFDTGGTEGDLEHQGHLTAMTSTQAFFAIISSRTSVPFSPSLAPLSRGSIFWTLPRPDTVWYTHSTKVGCSVCGMTGCLPAGAGAIILGNPFCAVITGRDQKCTAGDAYQPTSSTQPGSDSAVLTLKAGRVVTCVEDLPDFWSYLPGGSSVTRPSCAFPNLPLDGAS